MFAGLASPMLDQPASSNDRKMGSAVSKKVLQPQSSKGLPCDQS